MNTIHNPATTNIDQWVFRVAGGMTLLSVVLALLLSPWWLILAGFVGLNMLQASFSGFCPLAMILDRFGVRPGAAFCASGPRGGA